MDRFVSNFTLRLDAKGRVSIPASYRAVLARDGFDGLYCYPALDQPAVDAGGNALLAEIEALIETLSALFGRARRLHALALRHERDAEDRRRGQGDPLRRAQDAMPGITEAIAFVGLGHKFQIWEPGRFRAQLAEATGTVRALKKQLGSRVAAHEAQKARE